MTDAVRAILDKLDPEQIEAYLMQRKREAWLAHGCGDGFERLLVERDLTEFILPPGCWVWRDGSGQIRRAFGWVDGPNFTKQIMLWVTFDEDERAITSGCLWAIPTSSFEDRSTRNLAWLAEVRTWLLTQPIERLTSA